MLRLIFMLLGLAGLVSSALAQTHPAGFEDEMVIGGLDEPTALLQMPDGKLLVGLRTGVIRVVLPNGTLLPKAMLTIPVHTFEETGLLGLALHPQYPTQPFLYVFHSPTPGTVNRVTRYAVTADTVVAGSAQVMIEIPMGDGYHLGSCIRTTADGYLWVSTGDTGRPQLGYPQQLDRLEGKLLRLNLDGSIPATNPFVGVAGAREEIYQLGLRNPFRFAIQSGTAQPFICDVGQSAWEEIDAGVPGANFGWPIHEGPVVPEPAGMKNPLYAYDTQGSASITGCLFYTGTNFPAEFRDNLFFLDHSRGQIGRMVLGPANEVVSVTQPWATTQGEGWGTGPVDLMLGLDGALYYTQYAGQQIRRLRYGPLVGVDPADLPRAVLFEAPRPNPMSSVATLRFALPALGRARLRVFDVQGRLVRLLCDGDREPGTHAEAWDGADDAGNVVPPGLYFARLEAGGLTLSQRIVRVR
jgi:glucose/arabinose dehydrogenase